MRYLLLREQIGYTTTPKILGEATDIESAIAEARDRA
jgi:hypothetical protein